MGYEDLSWRTYGNSTASASSTGPYTSTAPIMNGGSCSISFSSAPVKKLADYTIEELFAEINRKLDTIK